MNPEPPRLLALTALTMREQEVLHWVAEGKANSDIGRILGCSEGTVKKHLQHIFPKLGVETRTAAAIAYLRENSAPRGPSGLTDAEQLL